MIGGRPDTIPIGLFLPSTALAFLASIVRLEQGMESLRMGRRSSSVVDDVIATQFGIGQPFMRVELRVEQKGKTIFQAECYTERERTLLCQMAHRLDHWQDYQPVAPLKQPLPSDYVQELDRVYGACCGEEGWTDLSDLGQGIGDN